MQYFQWGGDDITNEKFSALEKKAQCEFPMFLSIPKTAWTLTQVYPN